MQLLSDAKIFIGICGDKVGTIRNKLIKGSPLPNLLSYRDNVFPESLLFQGMQSFASPVTLLQFQSHLCSF